MSKIKINLKKTNAAGKRLGSLRKPLTASGIMVVESLLRNWNRGKGGDGTTLQDPPISEEYREQKLAKRGVGKIDMLYNGDLRKSLDVRNVTEDTADVSFAGAENLEKARKNFKLRPQMLKIGKTIRRKVRKIFLNFINTGKV